MTSVKSLVGKSYHGVKPPTKEDAKIGKKHLDMTGSLIVKKIQEHRTEKTKAEKMGDKESAHYHKSHIKEHDKELKKNKKSKQTLAAIRSGLRTRGA